MADGQTQQTRVGRPALRLQSFWKSATSGSRLLRREDRSGRWLSWPLLECSTALSLMLGSIARLFDYARVMNRCLAGEELCFEESATVTRLENVAGCRASVGGGRGGPLHSMYMCSHSRIRQMGRWKRRGRRRRKRLFVGDVALAGISWPVALTNRRSVMPSPAQQQASSTLSTPGSTARSRVSASN